MNVADALDVIDVLKVLDALPEADGEGSGSYLYLSEVVAQTGIPVRVVEDILWGLWESGRVEVLKDLFDDPNHPWGEAQRFHNARIFARIKETSR